MYKFEQYLNSDEKILYKSRPEPGKGSKNVAGELLAIVFILIIQILLIWSVITKTGDGAKGINGTFIIIFLIDLALQFYFVCSIIYRFFFKDKAVKDDFYYLTNQRVFKYETKKEKLVYGYLINYDEFRTFNIEGDYGDVYLGIILGDDRQSLNNDNIPRFPNLENMPYIVFESIKFPNEVAKLAVDARKSLKK